MEASPLDSILDLVAMRAGINDFLDFPLLLFIDDYWQWWWLLVSWDGFVSRTWRDRLVSAATGALLTIAGLWFALVTGATVSYIFRG